MIKSDVDKYLSQASRFDAGFQTIEHAADAAEERMAEREEARRQREGMGEVCQPTCHEPDPAEREDWRIMSIKSDAEYCPFSKRKIGVHVVPE